MPSPIQDIEQDIETKHLWTKTRTWHLRVFGRLKTMITTIQDIEHPLKQNISELKHALDI